LRALAILYLVAAGVVLIYGIWRAASVLIYGQTPDNFFGEPTGWAGRISVAASYLAVSFFGVLFMVAVAELIKLFVDIEHNTRLSALHVGPATASTDTAQPAGPGDGRTGGRLQWIEGEETAEGALLRGH
jgi:hypothetical protein